ncbi:phytoene/squalene synthase family protein [Luedemannella helvata]|uniref:Phytoene/squalene synthase family protein n=1 Tax=Luedemannella helvata TaxID=349315 RepID=A0ABN2JQZ6_9ACTN
MPSPSPTLTSAYERCRRLNARYGRSFYLATLLLPAWKRRHVHALYGLTRYADEIVDDLAATAAVEDRARALATFADEFFAALDGAPTHDPLLPAVVHTVRAFDIDREIFERFFRAMTMDLTVTAYETYDDTLSYMEGSAAVIGEMTLPILEPLEPAAREPARQLGFAFQLTNFVRDIGEDLARGRVYLPAQDLARFGVTRDDLAAPRASAAVRSLLAFEIARAREHYAAAEPGIDLLAPSSRPCVRTAHELYGGILRQIERADYEILRRRVAVPARTRLGLFARAHRAAARAHRAELR